MLVTLMPVPVGKYWTDKPRAGRAMDCASSAAAQDVPSAEPGQLPRTRTAQPGGRHARDASLAHVSLRGERWLARRQARETLYKPGVRQQVKSGGWQPGETLDQTGESQECRIKMGPRLTSRPAVESRGVEEMEELTSLATVAM